MTENQLKECLNILDIGLKLSEKSESNKTINLDNKSYIDDLICGNDMIANKPFNCFM